MQMESIRNELLDLLLRGEDISAILQAAYKWLGNPLALGDSVLRMIAFSDGFDPVPQVWEDLIEHGYAPPLPPADNPERIHTEADWILMDQYVGCRNKYSAAGWETVLTDIRSPSGGDYILLLSGCKKPISDGDREILELVIRTIVAYSRQHRLVTEMEGVTYDRFIVQLASGQLQSDSTIKYWASVNGVPSDVNYSLLVVRLTPYHPLRDRINRFLPPLLVGKQFVYFENNALMLICGDMDDPVARSDAAKIDQFLRAHEFAGVLSRSFDDLSKTSYYYKMTDSLLNANERPCGLRLYDKEETLFIIQQMLTGYTPECYIHPALKRLMAADADHKLRYVETLYMYLRTGMKKDLACEKLYIHRNTLDYRLNKIQEVLGVDFSNGDFLTRIYLSLCMLFPELDARYMTSG